MKKLLDQNDFLKPLKVGDIVRGQVVGLGRSSLFIDLGIQGTGIVYGKEFLEAKDKMGNLKVGGDVFAKVIDIENEQGYIELSLKEADQDITLQNLREKKEKGETIKVKILGANKGGLLAKISGVPVFLPASQLTIEHYPRIEKGDKNKILKELQKLVGKELLVQIFDIDLKEKKIILSEKAKDSEKIKELLKNYKVGDVVEGEITGLVDFGAFMSFGSVKSKEKPMGKENLEGLIHISELDWQLVKDPSEIVKIGQKVKAKIIEITDDRISLSLKALKKDPWEGIAKIYKKGDIIKGKVVKFNPFGAFVEISSPSEVLAGNSGIQGLVHISEFGSQKKMEESLRIGKEYDFEITMLNPREHKMILKLSP